MTETVQQAHTFTIAPQFAGQRLDNYLFRVYPNIPKSRLYQMMRKGEIRRNKGRVKPDYKVQAGDIIRMPPLYQTVRASASVPPYWQETIAQSILYQDEHFLILNKPAGIAVHVGTGNDYGVIEAIEALFGKDYAFLAHRIDKETSGLLVLAKTRTALADFQNQLKGGQVDKRYLALVDGHWTRERVEIQMEKIQAEDGDRMIVAPNGKEALTEFRVLKRFSNASLIEAHIFTGRTHQIRVSVQHCGHAIAGDDKYGKKTFNQEMKRLGYKNMFLHAHRLAFNLNEQTRLAIIAPLNQEAETLLIKLENHHE